MDATSKNPCCSSYENALPIHHNNSKEWENPHGKTIDSSNIVAIRSPRSSVPRAVRWTEEEHRGFLYGLHRFGRGKWGSISMYCVPTKSVGQVSRHARNFFERMTVGGGKRRHSINDKRSLDHETIFALEKATERRMSNQPEEGANQMLRPKALSGMSVHSLDVNAAASVTNSSPVVPAARSMVTAPFAGQPAREPIGMSAYPPPTASEQDCSAPPSSFDVPCTSYPDYIDPILFENFPHYLD